MKLEHIAVFASLIVSAICTGGGLYEQLVLDTAWPKRPSIVRPVEGGANRKLFWAPANLINIILMLFALLISWAEVRVRFYVISSVFLYAIVDLSTIFYFGPAIQRVEKYSIQPYAPTALLWVTLSRFRTVLSLLATIGLALAASNL